MHDDPHLLLHTDLQCCLRLQNHTELTELKKQLKDKKRKGSEIE